MSQENDFPSLSAVRGFFGEQLERWDDARHRFEKLKEVKIKQLRIDGLTLLAQFNPSRIVSTGAKIDKGAIAKRPCFLCEQNRPPQQIKLSAFGGEFQVLINPFPILPGHLVIACASHVEQRLGSHFRKMCVMAAALPGYMVFYNGPKCGASAPDHLHFQAGMRGGVPIERDWSSFAKALRPVESAKGLYFVENYACPAMAIEGGIDESVATFDALYNRLQLRSGAEEFPMNVVVWKEDGKLVTVVFLRSKHRPDCYFAEGKDKLLVSPGSVDMGGLLITPREEDFNAITAQKAAGILGEVAFSKEEVEKYLA